MNLLRSAALVLLIGLGGCVGEYKAGDLGTCYSDLNFAFCKVTDTKGSTVVGGASVLNAVAGGLSDVTGGMKAATH